MRRLSFRRIALSFSMLLLFAGASAQAAPSGGKGKKKPASSEPGTIGVLMISDIHLDPFHDPSKVEQLAASPVAQWNSILSASPAPEQQQAFAALQQRCYVRGVDSPYALFQSSLQAMRGRQADVRFVIVSGDLIAHAFACRYRTLFPKAKPGDYQAFVLKTLTFVAGELISAFPNTPVYIALGNNDTACGDYQLDAGSDFLDQTATLVAQNLPPSQQQDVLATFPQGGYYSVMLNAPMRNTRLIVLNDVFMSPRYLNCAGKRDSVAGTEEIAWLRAQLIEARKQKQRVWVIGHIPAGVDPYSTAKKFKDICGKDSPEMFLASDELSDLLIEYADVVKLGVFAHSHMDEMRLLKPEDSTKDPSGHAVPIKIVPSISPVDGNNPSFTIAHVDRASAVLRDYEVIAASDQTGVGTTWTTEYDYAQAYNEPDFSGAALADLIARFKDDENATSPASRQYLRNYFVGDRSTQLKPLWQPYICALPNHTGKAFAACVCSLTK